MTVGAGAAFGLDAAAVGRLTAAAAGAAGEGEAGAAAGRGLHSSTFQINLSHF